MNKNQFISELDRNLNGIPYEEKKEIFYDYEEHFRIGLEKGKTEDEICIALGDPKTIAKNYKADYTIEEARKDPSSSNVLKAVFAAVSLTFFNLIFVLIPFILMWVVAIVLFAAALVVVSSGFGVFLSSLIPHIPHFIGLFSININPTASILIGIGITCIGILFLIGDIYLSKYFYVLTVKYLNWNISIIKKQGGN